MSQLKTGSLSAASLSPSGVAVEDVYEQAVGAIHFLPDNHIPLKEKKGGIHKSTSEQCPNRACTSLGILHMTFDLY